MRQGDAAWSKGAGGSQWKQLRYLGGGSRMEGTKLGLQRVVSKGELSPAARAGFGREQGELWRSVVMP